MSMDIIDRARKYMEACPDAVGGQGGHATTFGVACALVWGFGLNEQSAMGLMMEYNQRCLPKWTERELLHKITSALGARHEKPRGWMAKGNAEEGPIYVAPKKREKLAYVPKVLESVQRRDWNCDLAWLRERSAMDPHGVECGAFIDGLYEQHEAVMVFTSMRSRGDYMRYKRGWYALGKDPQMRAQRVAKGPMGSREGCVMMIQPVDGRWHPVQGSNPPRLSRRTRESVTSYRYMLWESDEAPVMLWLNAIAQVRLPIVAITSSGGRSLHALVRVDAASYDAWTSMRSAARDVMTQLGFDPQALSNPTAAMRMPNTMREGKNKDGRFVPFPNGAARQRLLYYHPRAALGECIGEMPVRTWGEVVS